IVSHIFEIKVCWIANITGQCLFLSPPRGEWDARAHSPLCGNQSGLGVADEYGWCGVWGGYRKVMLAKQLDLLVHSPFGLVEAILDGITDAGKTLEIGGVETEEFTVLGGFYDE